MPVIALAAGRVAIGGAVFVRPTVLARGLGVDSATAERTAWLARMFAVRDLALGVGVLWTAGRAKRGGAVELVGEALLGRGVDTALKELLLLGALSDAGDALAVGAALRQGSVRRLPGVTTLVTAVCAASVGAFAAIR
jgi:hypothetical protein